MPEPSELSRQIDYLVIGGYLAMLLAVGFVLRRFNRDISDYFRSGCKATWWLIGASTFIQVFSAWTFTGAAGMAFESGWSVMILAAANAMGFFFNFLFLAPWFRQLRAITVAQVIEMRFGLATQQFYAWLGIVLQLLYSGVHLYTLAIIVATVFNFDISVVIVFVGAVVVIYSTIGGNWAVLATDFLQALILVPLSALVAILCLREVGGVGGLFEMIQVQGLSSDYRLFNDPHRFDQKFTYVWAVALFLKQAIGYNSMSVSARYFAVKDGAAARKAALLACVLMLISMFFWIIPPITARLLFAADVNAVDIQVPAEASFVVASMKLLPLGLTGLMVVAMFAATMSSTDTGLNRNAAIFTRDIFPLLWRLIRRSPLQSKTLLVLGKVYSLGFGCAIIAFALYFSKVEGKGVFEIVLDLGAMLGLPLAVPMLLALFLRRVPSWAAIASVVAGLFPSLVAFLSIEPWTFQQKVFTNMAASTVVFVGSALLWSTASDRYRQKVNHFFKTMLTPVDFAKEVGQPNDLSQLKIVGGFAVGIGLFICGLMVLPNPIDGRLSILFVGGFVLVVGLSLVLTGVFSKSSRHSGIDSK